MLCCILPQYMFVILDRIIHIYMYIYYDLGSKVGSATTLVTKRASSSALPEISLIVIDEVCSYEFIYIHIYTIVVRFIY